MKDNLVHSDRSLTSLTLLDRAKAREPGGWDEFVQLYQPLIYYWCRQGRNSSDAEELTQEVLCVVVEHLADFQHNGHRGAFRTWLRTIARRLIIDRYRGRVDEPEAVGGSTANHRLHQMVDAPPAEPSEQELSQELALLYHRAVELIRNEFSTRHYEFFRRVVENGEAPRDVAADLGVSANTVSIAVSRIKKCVRERFGNAID